MLTFAYIVQMSELCRRCNGTGKEVDHADTGRKMRAKRLKANLSLRQVAEAMDKSAPYVSDLELGRRYWNTQVTAQYLQALRNLAR